MTETNALTTTQAAGLALIAEQLDRDPRLKSRLTRQSYAVDLAAFLGWKGSRPVTRLLVEEYAARLQKQNMAPATINRKLAAVRWWCRRAADLTAEDATLDRQDRADLIAQADRAATVGDVRGTRLPRGRHITSGELVGLLTACEVDPRPAGARDAALIALAWATGARRSELSGLDLDDLRMVAGDEAELVIRHGKGDKVRKVSVYNGALIALVDWLEIRGDEPGPLFWTIDKNDRLRNRRLMPDPMRKMLLGRLAEGKLPPMTWHDFRRTFAGNLLDQGVDLATVQRLMGHSSPVTTSNYDRRGDEVKRQAVKKIFVPYTKRHQVTRDQKRPTQTKTDIK